MRALVSIKAFADNYIWLMRIDGRAWVVDPGEATGVIAYLDEHALPLEGILLTHHHDDHTGGVTALRERWPATKVYGPARERLPDDVARLQHGEAVDVAGMSFQVIDVPGHTAGHIAYFTQDFAGRPLLFCGDTLFSGGCGRLFEGTAAQMLTSLDRLAALPGDTVVCCAHEYTLNNLRFASVVEPENSDLAAYVERCTELRQRGEATVPSSIAQELKINPFLRSRTPSVRRAVQQAGTIAAETDDVAFFAALRGWKDRF